MAGKDGRREGGREGGHSKGGRKGQSALTTYYVHQQFALQLTAVAVDVKHLSMIIIYGLFWAGTPKMLVFL